MKSYLMERMFLRLDEMLPDGEDVIEAGGQLEDGVVAKILRANCSVVFSAKFKLKLSQIDALQI